MPAKNITSYRNPSICDTNDEIVFTPKCYKDINGNSLFGYWKMNVERLNPEFVPITGYTECSGNISEREICVTYYIDNPANPGTPLATTAVLLGIYEVTSTSTSLSRVEHYNGVSVTQGTAIGQYEILGTETCNCDTERL